MRVLFAHSESPLDPASGGIGSYIRHRGFVLAGQGIETWWSDGVTVARFDRDEFGWKVTERLRGGSSWARRLGRYWFPWSSLWKLACSKGISVIEFADGVTMLWPKRRPFAIGIQCHTSQFVRAFLNLDTHNPFLWALKRRLAFYTVCMADGVLVPSAGQLWLTSGYMQIHPDRFSILPHAFHSAAIPHENAQVGRTCGNDFLVAGNLEVCKGFDLIARGFLQYRRQGGKGRLIVAGTTGWADPNPKLHAMLRRPEVLALVQHEGRQVIHFLGRITQEELSRWRARCVAAVVGSRHDAFPMVVGEALLSGCPVILSDRTGWQSLAERFQAARLVNPYDSDDFEAAFREMENPELRRRWQEGGYRLAAWLTGPELAAATASWYRRLAGQRVRSIS